MVDAHGPAGRGAGVTHATAPEPLTRRVAELLERRTEANARFFEDQADRIARLCHLMAERFARGGRLVAFGGTPADRSDVRHVAVEFVHPVIVGKRALPAIGLAHEGGPLSRPGRPDHGAGRHRDRIRHAHDGDRAVARDRAGARLPHDRLLARRCRLAVRAPR